MTEETQLVETLVLNVADLEWAELMQDALALATKRAFDGPATNAFNNFI